MQLLNNLNYVAICVIGGMQVAEAMRPEMSGFRQSRVSSPAYYPNSQHLQCPAIHGGFRAVFELLDEEKRCRCQAPSSAETGEGHVEFRNVSFHMDVPLIENLNLEVKPGRTVPLSGQLGQGRQPGQPLDEVLRNRRGSHSH